MKGKIPISKMSSTKRKALGVDFQRRVRARRGPSIEPEDLSDSAPSEQENGNGSSLETDSESEDEANTSKKPGKNAESQTDESSESDSEPEEAASISFGALAKAHAALQRGPKDKSSKIIKKGGADDDGWEDNEAKERKEGRKDRRDFNRTNKHAPTEISSKKAVSRKREVVPVAKREHRDPRFEPLSGYIDPSKVRKAYSFLDEYREDEMKELKDRIKKAKDEGEKEKLKRKLLSMESRKKAQDRKDKAEEVLARHKKEEKDLVKQGKKPFYLKEAEQKKRVLLDTYSTLKPGQLDRVIERRRKKVEGKEKKKMPWARREFD